MPKFENTEALEQKLNDYRRIQDRNDYECVNVCSSFLAKVITHLEKKAQIPKDELIEFIQMKESFNLEELIDHFTKYSYKK